MIVTSGMFHAGFVSELFLSSNFLQTKPEREQKVAVAHLIFVTAVWLDHWTLTLWLRQVDFALDPGTVQHVCQRDQQQPSNGYYEL